MEILVIRFTSMGDVILATTVFSYLKRAYPDCRIHFLTDAGYAELFKDDPRLETVEGVDKTLGIASCRRLFDTRWDRVIDLQNNRRSRFFKKKLTNASLSGTFQKQHRNRMLLLLARLDRYDPGDHVARRYLAAAGGIEKDQSTPIPPLRIIVSDNESKRVQATVFSGHVIRPLIALFPFSAWKNKEWMRQNFIVVGRYFLTKGWNVAVLGGPEDERGAIDMQREIGSRCKALAGSLSLYECACLLKGSSLALGNDTGLSHLARACGVKTGMIFGPTTRQFGFFPFGDPPYKVFQTDCFCRPCHPHGGNICVLRSRPCLRRITPETVIRGLESLHSEPEHYRVTESFDDLKR
jgi:heptosyltransferase-2